MPELMPLRWGILGAGNIAKKFTLGAQVNADMVVVAVGSRDLSKANAFAKELNIERAHGSYEALVSDPDIDVIYVATPHPHHKECTLLALNHSKPVLCEKPFTMNAGETEELIDAAHGARLFLMEGMWSRFFPAMFKLRELLAQKVIGEPRMLHADFGFRTNFDPNGRLFDPLLGGGALLDVGIYPISLSSMIFGEPDRITGLATMCETGVDEQSAFLLGHPGGSISVLSTAVRTETPHTAVIMGTEGMITIPAPFWKPQGLIIQRAGKPEERIDLPTDSTGFQFEAAHVAECLREGRIESPVIPLSESLSIMRTLDTLRAQWGLTYPTEQA